MLVVQEPSIPGDTLSEKAYLKQYGAILVELQQFQMPLSSFSS